MNAPPQPPLIPAKAGIHGLLEDWLGQNPRTNLGWVPAFAGTNGFFV